MDTIYDLIIIGQGPAGLSASLYAKRAGLNFILLKDNYQIDSQIINTYEVDNYLGIKKTSGQDLYNQMFSHLNTFDINIVAERVIEIQDENAQIKKVLTKKNTYLTRTIILATGQISKKLNCKGEEEYSGCGVSYCATCDGAFYKNKICIVVGGGNVAIEDAIFLSRLCKKVYVAIRKSYMKADKVLQDELLLKENVEVLYNTEIIEIKADDIVNSVVLCDNNTNLQKTLMVDGVFIAIGQIPQTSLLKNKIKMENDYIIADETCKTELAGIFACGDIRTKQLRQVITAVSDGANAITSVLEYIK